MSKKYPVMALLCISLFASIYFAFHSRNEEIVLEFAMFNGSNWSVEMQDSYSVIDRAIKRFEQKYPQVKIKYTGGIPKEEYSEWLGRKLLRGDSPDVMMIDERDFVRYSKIGVLEALDSYMERDSSFDKERYFRSAIESGRVNRMQYALPFQAVPYFMFVNRTLLNKEGIAIPEGEFTFDTLYSLCEQVTKDLDGDGLADQFGIYKYGWQEAAVSNGVNLFSEDGRQSYFNDEKLSFSIRFVKSLEALQGHQVITQEMFDDGRVAFMPLNYAQYRTYKAYPYKMKKYTGFQWDCIAMPAGPDGKSTSGMDSLHLGIGRMSRNKAMAWEFLKFLTGDEEVQKDMFLHQPAASVLHSVMEDSSLNTEGLIEGELINHVMEFADIRPRFEGYAEAVQIADSEIEKLYATDDDVDNALRLIQRKVQEYLRER